MVDILKHPLIEQAYEVCRAIERCPAGPEETTAVTLASKLMESIDTFVDERCPKCGTYTRRAPVQGFSAGIPWEMHLRAYDVYCKRYGKQQALIEGWCRGGFGTTELDEFIPGWRDELSRLKELEQQLKEANKKIAELLPKSDWRIGLSAKPKFRSYPSIYDAPIKIVAVLPTGTGGLEDKNGILKLEFSTGAVILARAEDWVMA